MQAPVRLAIVDDHAMLLESMVEWIGAYAPDFTVVAAATTWPALVHSPAFPAELVLMDFQLGDAIALEARIRTCRAAGSDVIVFSGGVGGHAKERSLAAGALAFISKTVPMEGMMDMVREAIGREGGAPPAASPSVPKLSQAERQALYYYGSGLSLQDVAEKMGVQYETAKTFLRRVRQKYRALGRSVSRRDELTKQAAADGLLEAPVGA